MKAFLQICHVGRYVRTPETQSFWTVGCDRPQLSKDILLKYQKTLVYMCLIYKHTHTHTHLSSLYAYIYANQETGLCADTVRYLAYSMRKEVGCGCFSLLSGRGKQPFRVSNGVLSYSIDVL